MLYKNTFNLFKAVIAIGMLLSCSACVSNITRYHSAIPTIDTTLFGKRPNNIPSLDDIFGVNNQHAKRFLNYYENKKNKNIDPHRRVAKYVENLLAEFEYNNKTLNTNVALSKLEGDCMTLATLTTALSHLVGIKADYRFINNSPFYDQRGDVVVRSNHVRTVLYNPDFEVPPGALFSFRPHIKIDFYPSPGDVPGRRINQRQFIGMFYRNLAAIELTNKNYQQSFWLLMEAVNVAPYDNENINMMAILHRRSGMIKKAEELYLYGLENADSKVAILRNYRILLRLENRFDEAELITKQLANLDDPNPFNWIHVAEDHFAKHDYPNAIHYFNKAVKTAPYLHHGYIGLAKTYYKQGKNIKAERALKNALENSPEGMIRERYQSKLDALLKVSLNQTN